MFDYMHQTIIVIYCSVMIEASGNVITQSDFVRAMKLGVNEAQQIITAIQQLQAKIGKPKRPLSVSSAALRQEVKDAILRYIPATIVILQSKG